MLKNIVRRISSIMLACILIFNMFPPIIALADTSLESAKLPDGLSASWAGETENSRTITWTPSVSDGVGSISGTAVAGKKCAGTSYTYYGCDTTLTITNISGSDQLLEFSYGVEVSGAACQVTVAGTTYKETKTGLVYSATLKSTDSITVNLKTEASENSTAKVTISGLKLVSANQDITVTFDVCDGGSYTANSVAVTEKTNKTNVATTVYNLVATPASGYSFCGWMNALDSTLLGTSTTLSITPKDGMIIKPVFASSTEPWFVAGGTKIYNDLNTAATYANSVTTKTVVLLNSAKLGAGEYTIPAGVTLVIPYDNAHTVVTNNPAVVTSYSTSTAPSAYRTLTMSNNAKLILNGNLSVGGTLVASQTNGYNGLPTGKLGYIKMEQGSSIEANSGSSLYIVGYIHGDGEMKVHGGATVYECFQIRDFRGGNATGSMRSAKKTFPLSQYYVQNIEVPMTIEAGAIVNAMSAFNISGGFQIPVVPFIGNSSSYMFQITDGNIVKDYIETSDRLNVQINGTLSVSPFTFEVPGFGGMASIDTKNFILPINHNITVEVSAGKSISISQNIQFLPGSELLISEGATCTVSSENKLIVYDSANWGNYCGEKHHSTGDDVAVKPLLFVAGGAPKLNRFTADASSLADGSIKINGTLDASSGALYVTEGGANIYSTANGKLKLGNAPSTLTTYQATQDGSSISYTTIYAYAAKLKNQSGDYFDTTGTSAANYDYDLTHNKWVCETHTDTEPDGICDVCGLQLCEHTNTTVVTGTPASCTVSGLTDGVNCADCGVVITAQSEIPATGHQNLTEHPATAATCIGGGNSAYWQCADCNLYFADAAAKSEIQEGAWELPQISHSGGTATCVNKAVCSGCGAEYGDYGDHIYDSGVVTTNPTCTAEGVKTYTCTVSGCTAEIEGHSYTEVIAVLGHSADENGDHICDRDGCSYVVSLCKDYAEGTAAKAATCSEAGNSAYWTCTLCGKYYSDADCTAEIEKDSWIIAIDGDAHVWDNACDTTCNNDPNHTRDASHSYGDWVVTTEATCEQDGVKTKTCSVCKDEQTETITKLGHKYESKVTAPTCTEKGYTTHTCACGSSYVTDEVAALGHTEQVVAGKAATCEGTGLTEGKICSVCKEELVVQEEIPAIGHAYEVTASKEATCTEDGYKTYTCTNDNAHTYNETLEKTGHTEQVVAGKAATCEETGLTEGKICSVCKVELEAQTEIPKLGHDIVTDAAVDPTCTETGLTAGQHCSRCDAETVEQEVVDALGHDIVVDEAVAPSCTETGLTEGSHCSRCDGATVAQEVVDALGHTEQVVAGKEATCEETGLTEGKICSVCKVELAAQEEIPAIGHAYEVTASKEATCTEGGYVTYTCTNDNKHTYTETSEKTGHTEQVVAGKAATCEETGLTAGKICSVCKVELEAQTEIPKLGHDIVVDEAVAPSCTETGLTEGSHCSRCDGATVAQEVVDALGHDIVIDQAVAPTCEGTGLTEGSHCTRCNDKTVEQEVVDALGHDIVVDETVAPTCTETGLTEGSHCSRCDGATVAQEVVDALGHTEQVVAGKAATCTEAGLSDGKICSECGTVLEAQEEIEATGHNYQAVVTEPTTSSGGYTTNICNNCNDSYISDEVPAIHVHTEETVAGKAPTCTEPGLTDGVQCSVCGETLTEQSEIPATGHKYEAVVTAPTCTEGGYTTYTCTCGDSYTGDDVEATGHNYKESVTKEATCAEAGEKSFSCACGESYTEGIDALGHDEVPHEVKAPTCTEIGWDAYVTCSRCDYTTYKETPALGHSLGDWIIDTEATSEAAGSKHRECANCDFVETEEIPATGGADSEEPEDTFIPNIGTGETFDKPADVNSSMTIYIGDIEVSVSAPKTGWKVGKNTFTVENQDDIACVVMVEDKNGGYQKLNATTVEGKHSFTAENLTTNDRIVVVRKGDANDDGRINNKDIILVKRLANKTTWTDYDLFVMNVVGNDSSIGNKEIIMIKRAANGTALSW